MPTRRMIDPAIWQSESIGRLTIRQRLMFIGMFSNADDQGRLRASAPVIRSMIFPFDDISIAEIETDILNIEHENCVMLYDVDGSRYAQVLNWWRYQQHQWAYPSRIPKPDGWIDRLRFRQKNQVITENWSENSVTQSPSIDQSRVDIRNGLGKSLGKDLPNGETEKPLKTRKKSDRDIAIDSLETDFISLSGLPAPARDTETQKKAGAKRWWNPLQEIWELCGRDTSNAEVIIGKAYQQMKKDKLTISAPASVLEVAKSIYAQNGNGQHANTTRHTEPEYTAEELAQAERINSARHAREAEMRKVQ